MPSNYFDQETHPPGFSAKDLAAMNARLDEEWAYMFKTEPMRDQPGVAYIADKVRKEYYREWFARHRDEWVPGAWRALVDWFVLDKR